MQKVNLLLFVASLGIAWVHTSTASAGYCCPQITVALGTADDGTYDFLAEGNGPAMEECQNACIYSKDSNKTDLYCFQAVTSEALGSGQVQCEAISPYSLLTSTTPAATGPTTEELLQKIADLQKDFEAQVNQTEALKKDLADQTKKTEDLEKDIDDQTKKTEDLEKDLAEQTKKTEDLEKDIGDQTKKTEDLEKDIDDQNKKTEGLEKDLADQTKKTQDLEKDMGDQNKKTEGLEKDLADQTKKTEDMEKDMDDQTKKTEDLEKEFDAELKKEVVARKAEVSKIKTDVSKMKTEVNSIDGRLNKAEKKQAVCSYKPYLKFSTSTTLTFDNIFDEVKSSSGTSLEKNGYFKAGIAGVYFVTLETTIGLSSGGYLRGALSLSSGSYPGDAYFLQSDNDNASGKYFEQAAAARYVNMDAGETLHIQLSTTGGTSQIYATTMCVSLYSARG